MFEFIITHTDTIVKYTYNNDSIEFVLDTVNKRLKDEILPDKVFVLLNGFIEKKGGEFKKAIYEALLNAKNTIFLEASKPELEPMPLNIIHDILNLFDFNEVKEYVKNSGLIRIPSMLPEKYDESIEYDEKGSREQTYLKDDYVELITLITILKSTNGVIGEYASVKNNILNKNTYKEYLLFTFYLTHPVIKTPPFKKIYDSIWKLIERLYSDRENTAIRVIEKQIDKENFALYITASVIIQKLLVNSELIDTDAKNTITKIYHFASSRIKLKDTSSSIKIKHFNNGEDDSGESESVLESYRTTTTLAQGSILEFRSVFHDPYRVAYELGLEATTNEIDEVLYSLNQLRDHLPIKEAIYIVSWLYKDITDIRSFDYLILDELIIAIGIGFLYLWKKGYQDIALIISSFSVSKDEFKLNFSLRNKLHPDIKDALQEMFPNNKAVLGIDGITESSFIEETIGTISKSIMGYNLYTVVPEKYIREVNRGRREVIIDESIKNRLAEYILFINGYNGERIEYKEK